MRWSRPTVTVTALWALLYGTAALLLGWSRDANLALLVAAAICAAVALALYLVCRSFITNRSTLNAAMVALLIGALGAVPIAWRLQRLGSEWEGLQADRHARTRLELDRRMSALLLQGRTAAEAVAASDTVDQRALFRRLELLLERTKVDALAVFGDFTDLRGWAGDHRGRFAISVLSATRSVSFVERPLYSYLYFVEPLRTGRGHAVAALLLDAALPVESSEEQTPQRIDLATDVTFLPGPGVAADWSLVIGQDTLLHARVEPITQSQWRMELLRIGQRFEALVVLLAVVLLSLAWFREVHRPARAPALLPFLGSSAALVSAPLGSALGLDRLFSPGLFLLPGPGDVSLGTMLAVLLVAALFVSTTRARGKLRTPLVFLAGCSALALAFPIAIRVLVGPAASTWEQYRAATPSLLQGGTALWAGLQSALVLLFSIVMYFVLVLARWPREPRLHRHGAAVPLLAAACALAASLSAALLLASRTNQHINAWLAALWFVPLALAGFGTLAYQREGRRLVRWLVAGWLSAMLVLPYLWNAEINTRLRQAERELATLGSKPDPFLDFLLRQFGREAIARRERGEDGYQLLYRSWVSSGLAQEAYPARIILWNADRQPEAQLRLGDAMSSIAETIEVLPPYLAALFVSVQDVSDPYVFTAHDVEDVNQVLVVPLDAGRRITVEVPPRRTFERASVIAPLLGTRADLSTRLELVPARTSIGGGIWRPTRTGWRSEAGVQLPDGVYHAHLEMRLPDIFVQIARGVLITATDLLVLLLLWLAGRSLRGEVVRPVRGWLGWLSGFRARVTAALFLFFLIPTIVFGTVAYGALAREVERAAQIVAERAVRQAVIEFQDAKGDLRELAAHAGAEVLLYFQGELQSASSPEALGLGVYNAWMPADMFLSLERGDEDAGTAQRTIGGQQFLTAYRRLQVAGTGTMAIPVSLESHETVLRQREMAHLILLAALVGGLLSLALSLAVGRTLARPIGRLQRAAANVGRGRLSVQLPEQTGDEFGQLFASFNRMVRRLRRARAQEIRTARVLAWGEMARQVAHEIKNPLTPIKLSVQHLRRAFADRRGDFEQTLDQSVDQILVEIDRLSDIARAFSRYGAPPESAGPLEPVHVAAVVTEAMTLYRTGDPQLHYIDNIEPGLPPVSARAGELKEVILNLLENARAATDPGGRIAVMARRQGDTVELTVEDNGVGMPAELLARIFEPHFSTRTTGTGLGLAIVRRLIENWGGTVDAESEAGRGTRIRIRLQIAELPN